MFLNSLAPCLFNFEWYIVYLLCWWFSYSIIIIFLNACTTKTFLVWKTYCIWSSSLWKFYGRHHDLVNCYGPFMSQMNTNKRHLSIMDVCSSVMRYIVSRIVSNYYLRDIMYSCQILWAFLSRIWLRFDITVPRFFFKHIFDCVIS
jgi:hypothetical protein